MIMNNPGYDMAHPPRSSPKPQDLASRLLPWFDRARRDLPWRQTRNPYRIWVAEIMLQQTQVARVIPYYRRFLRAFPTPGALAAAPLDDVLRLWAGLGYYSRARNIHAACGALIQQHGGRFPAEYSKAVGLPGVGVYTAGAILSIAFGQRFPAIDANARRVLRRVFCNGRNGLVPSRRRIETLGVAAVPEERRGDYNQALMELGALVCLPRQPLCVKCCLADICQAKRVGTQAKVPATRRARTVAGRAVVGVVERRGRILIAQRGLDGVWGGLWEFPNVEASQRGNPQRALHRLLTTDFGINVTVGEPIARLTYGIMKRRIGLTAYACTVVSGRTKLRRHTRARWARARDLDFYAFPAPHRRLADMLMGERVQLRISGQKQQVGAAIVSRPLSSGSQAEIDNRPGLRRRRTVAG